jgi:hypothetical protein
MDQEHSSRRSFLRGIGCAIAAFPLLVLRREPERPKDPSIAVTRTEFDRLTKMIEEGALFASHPVIVGRRSEADGEPLYTRANLHRYIALDNRFVPYKIWA